MNCGHNPPLLLRPDGARTTGLGRPRARHVGRRDVYRARPSVPGDTLVLYTDGVVEVLTPRASFGVERLEA